MQAFEETYKREFGFVLEQRSIIVDDLRVRATGKVTLLLDCATTRKIQQTFKIKREKIILLVISICIMSKKTFCFYRSSRGCRYVNLCLGRQVLGAVLLRHRGSHML